MERLKRWLERRGLVLNEKKTRLVDIRQEGIKFPGFALAWRRGRSGRSYPHVEPHPKSLKKLRDGLREKLKAQSLKQTRRMTLGEPDALCGQSGYVASAPKSVTGRAKARPRRHITFRESESGRGNLARLCFKPYSITRKFELVTSTHPWPPNGALICAIAPISVPRKARCASGPMNSWWSAGNSGSPRQEPYRHHRSDTRPNDGRSGSGDGGALGLACGHRRCLSRPPRLG